MEIFDYAVPAELYVASGLRGRRNNMSYRRFETSAKAIRYVIEELQASRLVGTVLEADGRRLYHKEIRALYDSEAYPLEKQSGEVTHAA